MRFPKWLARRDDGVMVVDPDIAYPAILAALKVTPGDVTQYWLETAYQVMKLDVQRIVEGTAIDPRPSGGPLVIKVRGDGGRKERWGQDRGVSPGRGARAATKGLEARQHFVKLRGKLPGAA